MKLEPIVNSRFKKFRSDYNLMSKPDGIAFEQYVNYSILTSHQPGAFNGDNELFSKVNVGGTLDMGIDGIAIKINDLIVKDLQEAIDLVETFPRVAIEFIFIQSKYKSNFDKGEFNNFIDGVRDFLSDTHRIPCSTGIKKLIEIKEYLLSEDVIFKWKDNPDVRLYYVVMGKWHNSKNQLALADQLKEDIDRLNTYGEVFCHFMDVAGFKNVLDSIDNNFEVSLSTIDTMPLTEVDDVENSCMMLCYASELNKLLVTNEGIIRKSLFDDNVRDFQGENSINSEISKTLKTEPAKFALLNNGITIVCQKYRESNRKITITNPQIVNGCQTSHSIFNSKEDEIDKAPVVVKIISTGNSDITNQIVRGTNRQNIVLDEAFETTKPFHKELEQFINALSQDYHRFYYERRSKQYNHNPSIQPHQKVNFRILIQSMVGMFLNEPHFSHRHESKLLGMFNNKLFLDFHSKLPYFTAMYTFYRLENAFRNDVFPKDGLYTYKYQHLMIFREKFGGKKIDLNSERMIDEQCQELLNILKSDEKFESAFNEVFELFESIKEKWTVELKNSIHGIKDNKEFTNLLLTAIQSTPQNESDMVEDENYQYKGKIVKIITDRYGSKCGFIEREPNNIFFHSSAAKGMDLSNAEGRYVTYTVSVSPKNKLFAHNVEFA